jgi:putative ABC transport system permease protein
MKLTMWFRWAWRDLRARWLQVAAIAIIIAMGTGIFAGLGGQETWRVESHDMSYAALQFHDLRVMLTTGSFVDQGELLMAMDGIDGVVRAEPRLVVDTLVDASNAERTILVPGHLVGVDTSQGGPLVDRIHVEKGRSLASNDRHVAVLETKFARYYDLEPGARVSLIGGQDLDIVGAGVSPEHFMILPEEMGLAIRGEANLAVLYVPLSTAQDISQREDMVNELRVQLASDADEDVVRADITERLAAALPGIGFRVIAAENDPVHSLLYTDAEEDQEMLDLIAVFFLVGAALAAFNLAGRIVESQRRQIGIGMALGAPRRWLAVRPLIVGLQIALIGTVLGLAMGLGFAYMLGALMQDHIPMPHYAGTAIHWPSFVLASALGILLPVVATLIPVWRAVRTPPLEALHGHLAAKDSGLNRWLKGVRLPGSIIAQMPLKNSLRSTKRSALTVLGLAVSIALLFLFLGLLDTVEGTISQAEQALLHSGSDRIYITLDSFYPSDHDRVQGLATLTTDRGTPLFADIEPGLRLGGRMQNGSQDLNTLVEFYRADSAIWRPALIDGKRDAEDDRGCILISRKAADDLGVEVGDTLDLEHPFREGPLAFRTASSTLIVAGIHDNPLRGLGYIATDHADMAGLEMLSNVVVVTPHDQVTQSQIQRALFTYPGIVAVQPAADLVDVFDEMMALLGPTIRMMQGAVLVIAFLIAYNSTSINIDDRMREVATMFAYGTPPRTVTWVQIGENLLLGVLGTALGALLGWLMLQRMLIARMEIMMEEIGLLIRFAPLSFVLTLLLGIGVVALTPLVSARRLRRIDIPSTLRVME